MKKEEEKVDDILDVARDKKYDTVVFGRRSFSWLKEMFHRHVADELVKKGQGLTLWVVE